MVICKSIIALQEMIQSQKKANASIGFVPTMGALHKGHIALVEAAKQANNFTICSIFVNPTQFNNPEDFEKYPISIEADIALLITHQCDVLFLPSVSEMYPNGPKLITPYPLGTLETILEGKYRPGHFQGVCQIVDRLLTIIQPHQLYMGSKDYQQCIVINRLLQLNPAFLKIQLHLQPTIREQSGLAMSSRNRRLSAENLIKAAALYQSLVFIQSNIQQFTIAELVEQATQMLLKAGFEKVDYISIADAATLAPISTTKPANRTIVLAAAYIQGVRLIDNLMIN
ncbi:MULTISPECIES: pantoate--beta-alanine ligase [unclassified Hydrotalea]|uniref:pantoate--beta-alanine ligase n=1 Tax=unclassified Hydrotalea TaxID=2643788 RepID=UPI0009434AAE|nr:MULTISPECIES: pantoate--beta-alanine ligase [unclassified Hydrotalea]RWZ87933.1 MAG: pantoate--beta-alanine ligase [Hydrotalea sp. AMD]